MEQITHSPFLQSLGYAIINSLWQYALLWLVYVVIHSLCKLTSHQKYISGLVVQIAGFTWFLGSFIFFYHEFSQLGQRFVYGQTETSTNLDTTLVAGNQQFLLWLLQIEKFLPYLSIAYLALLLFLCFKWLQAYRFTQSVRNTGLQKIEVNWRLFVQQLAFHLGIKRKVFIYISTLVKTPLTIGYFKPIILIPLASINHLNTQQMEAVILHELAHIKRYDYVINLFLSVIESLLFFNPFMQLISGHIKRERENCCDDWVLQYEYNSASYATALLQIATFENVSPIVLALKATDDKQVLLNRIKRMIEKKDRTFFYYRHQLMALIVMTTVFSLLAYLSPSKKSNNRSLASPAMSKNTTLTPFVAKIENPLFNPVSFLFKNKQQQIKVTVPNEKTGNAQINVFVVNREPQTVFGKKMKEKIPADNLVKTFPPVNITPVLVDNNDAIRKEMDLTTAKAKAEFEKARSIFTVEGKKMLQKQLTRLSEVAVLESQKNMQEDEVRQELNSAIEQLKAVKIHLELAKTRISNRATIRSVDVENEIDEVPAKINLSKGELKLMAEQIQRGIEDIKLQYNKLITPPQANFNFNVELPTVLFVPEQQKTHLFSYDYKTKTRGESRSSTSANSVREGEANLPVENNGLMSEAPLPPVKAEAPRRVTVKGKNVYIIRI